MGKLVGQGEPLPSKLIWKKGRGEKASWAGRAPAEQAYKERRQGRESELGRENPCRASLYGKKAGEEKLVGQGESLPSKLIRKEGRGEKACWAGRAPAEQAYKERRQGWGSLLGRETWCSSTKNCSDSFLVELLIETLHQDCKKQNHSGASAGKRSTRIVRSRIIVERLPGNAPPGS